MASPLRKSDCAQDPGPVGRAGIFASFMFPLFILGRFFVELQVAVIPAGLNVPGLGGLAQGAARLFPVVSVRGWQWDVRSCGIQKSF